MLSINFDYLGQNVSDSSFALISRDVCDPLKEKWWSDGLCLKERIF